MGTNPWDEHFPESHEWNLMVTNWYGINFAGVTP